MVRLVAWVCLARQDNLETLANPDHLDSALAWVHPDHRAPDVRPGHPWRRPAPVQLFSWSSTCSRPRRPAPPPGPRTTSAVARCPGKSDWKESAARELEYLSCQENQGTNHVDRPMPALPINKTTPLQYVLSVSAGAVMGAVKRMASASPEAETRKHTGRRPLLQAALRSSL